MTLPKALTISATETLALLDGPFASMAKAIANDSYAFWLGSGISRDRMPPLGIVVRRALEFLRTRSADDGHKQSHAGPSPLPVQIVNAPAYRGHAKQ